MWRSQILIIVGKAIGFKTVHLAEILVPRTIRHIIIIVAFCIHHSTQRKSCVVHARITEERFQSLVHYTILYVGVVIFVFATTATLFLYFSVEPTEFGKQIVSIFSGRLVCTGRHEQTYGTCIVAHALRSVSLNSLVSFGNSPLVVAYEIIHHTCCSQPQAGRLDIGISCCVDSKLHERHRLLAIHLLGINSLKPFGIVKSSRLLVERFLYIVHKVLYEKM